MRHGSETSPSLETQVGSDTLLLPGEKQPDPPGRRPASSAGTTLPPDLRRQALQRLRVIALAYSAAFFFADVVPSFFTGMYTQRTVHLIGWLPSVLSIIAGLLVAWVASSRQLDWRNAIHLGLLFEVAGSYGIAIAQYSAILHTNFPPDILDVLSPSWVAVWFVFYSIAIPTPPRLALGGAIAAATAPPVILTTFLYWAGHSDWIQLPEFFFSNVLPNAICVGLAYTGSRVVYRLGRDVIRARELGSYHLTERLGTGGMGEVWLATHQVLARPAAIKFIRPDSVAAANPEETRILLARFQREARATAALTSAHTVRVYDYGVTDDGTFYYVMELLDGLDLERFVRRFGPLPPARIVHLLVQACEALEEAHGRGLIHRDVKPANIYTCRTGVRCDFVKVLDFGLVMKTGASTAREDLRLTLPGRATGTPTYMAPEVARGESVDGRTDLYALGCVAYWLATGQLVFGGTSVFDVISQHLQATPEPPSRHAPAPLPSDLEAIVLGCLEKDPARRPPDARTLQHQLRAVVLEDRWEHEEAEAWWRTHLPAGAADGMRENAEGLAATND
jgi:tRNA A-37 threonylcarbamoyl transferase component Bud32